MITFASVHQCPCSDVVTVSLMQTSPHYGTIKKVSWMRWCCCGLTECSWVASVNQTWRYPCNFFAFSADASHLTPNSSSITGASDWTCNKWSYCSSVLLITSIQVEKFGSEYVCMCSRLACIISLWVIVRLCQRCHKSDSRVCCVRLEADCHCGCCRL